MAYVIEEKGGTRDYSQHAVQGDRLLPVGVDAKIEEDISTALLRVSLAGPAEVAIAASISAT